MKARRFQQYLKRKTSNTPIRDEKEVYRSSDEKIDQDFPGYPHGQAKEEVIKPKTATQKKTAAVDTKDGEKRNTTPAKRKKNVDEQDSDGSAGAFGGSEEVRE